VPNGASRSRKTAEVVAREIVRDIVDQHLQPGEMLPGEMAMRVRYGVGRPALREAIRVLEVQGFLRLKPGPGGGPVVRTVTPRAFGEMSSLFFMLAGTTYRELVEARLELEPLAARLAAQRRDDDTLAALRAVVDREDGIDPSDNGEYIGAARDFHAALTDAAGNRVLSLIASGLVELYDDRLQLPITPPEERGATFRSHRAIVCAIEAGDPERAEALAEAALRVLLCRLEHLGPDVLDRVIDWA
jgi:GntR family transcriptional repressor for pyruvate dehydrogenase complex